MGVYVRAVGPGAVARLESHREPQPRCRSVRILRAYASRPRAHPPAVAIASYSPRGTPGPLASPLTRQKPVPVGDDAGPPGRAPLMSWHQRRFPHLTRPVPAAMTVIHADNATSDRSCSSGRNRR